MHADTSPPPEPSKPMSFAELMMLTLKFNDRLDTLWQRVIYTHAALVGVMVFFARSPEPFLLQRCLVFFLYSVSAVITYVSIRDTYQGYRSALQDLAARKEREVTRHLQDWVRSRNVGSQTRRYAQVFLLAWAVLGYLLIGSLWWQ
ncbi:hypothetical protein [Roseivivax sp. CAU 1753]